MCQLDRFKTNSKVAAITLLLAILGFAQESASQTRQPKGEPVTVASVSSHASGNGTVVSIVADGPLNRAQTWQDREGYHVVVPSAATQNAIKVGSGIKVRQLDRSLEIVIQTKPGANVTVQAMANHLNINVDGKLDPRGLATQSDNTNPSRNSQEDSGGQQEGASKVLDAGKTNTAEQGMSARNGSVENTKLKSTDSGPAVGQPNSSGSAQDVPSGQEPETADGESSVISGTTAVLVVILGCLGLVVLRRRRSTQLAETLIDEQDDYSAFDHRDASHQTTEEANRLGKAKLPQESFMKQNSSGEPNGTTPQRKSIARMPVSIPAALYGAYQVDQEIGKLVLGLPHRMDVLASRAPDDRRAIEASLLKTLTSSGADEDLRRRACEALEEYGFVARQSATLLLSADPYERTSAARMLGDVKSPAALPFLLEALYDHESLVRNQAVLSIGELKLPSAIGALLDIARKHPDVPGSLLSRALSACSVEGLDFFDSPIPQPRLLSSVDAHFLIHDITQLEPASKVKELPESSDDERLVQSLSKIDGQDSNERSEAIKILGQFSVRPSVVALAKVARLDPEPSLKALAISSLASINHESVFPAILIAMADESREVRAAAARSLSRLSFDRADAYIRVAETDDAETLRDVAQSCIKAGIAAQGIDRLSGGDHQAYEALSVVSLLVKANAIEPLLEAITNHPNIDVRLTVVHLLGVIGHPGMIEQLRQLPIDSSPEVVKDALVETIAKLEAPENVESSTIEPQLEQEVEPELVLQGEAETQFEAQPESEAVVQPECETEPDEVENAGLPTPTIA